MKTMNGLVRRLMMPSGCRRVRRLMQAWLDGELPASQAHLVAVHLADCDRCGVEAATYDAVKASLARLGTPPDPAALDRLQRFAEELVDDTTGPPRSRRRPE